MKTLILTEKPSVARDFANALGVNGRKDGYLESNDYLITWAVGHLVELFDPEDYDTKWKKWHIDTLPIIPEQFRYKPLPAAEKQLEVIRKLLSEKSFDRLVIATDPGREGEVIARTVLLFSEFDQKENISRFWTSQALTPHVIKEEMDSLKPASDYDRLWKAGQARQIADWLIGMNASRAATLKMKDLFSVGRVQTAVLSLLADRRREREKFKPEPYWLLKVLFSNDKGNWQGIWFDKDESSFSKEEDGLRIASKIKDQTGSIISVKKQKKKQPPPLLYSLTDLQQDANTKFGYTAAKTLETAQHLYEEKYLSYPRTDAKVLGTKNVGFVKELIAKLARSYQDIFKGIQEKLISVSNKRVFDDAKLTDHHALIPFASLPENAAESDKKIYNLVLKRFAAAFYPDCEYEQTEIITGVCKETFRTRGKRMLALGWQMVYGKEELLKTSGDEEESEKLPPLAKGEPAKAEESSLEKKMTSPPPEYSEALLLKDMSNPAKYVSEKELKKIYKGDVGLGTQSTRAQIIETLLARKYIARNKKHLIAMDKGCFLIDTLRNFNTAKKLVSPEETARWEQHLHNIAQGGDSEKDFLDSIRNFVRQIVEEFRNMSIDKTIGECPACGGTIIEGKRGFGCSNWKPEKGACRFVIWKDISGRMITQNIVSRLLDSGEAGPLSGFISEDQQRFSAILRLVNENEKFEVRLERISGDSGEKASAEVLGACPACGGNVVEGPKGYGCANWRDQNGGCKFVIWKTIAQKEIPKEAAIQILENGITEKIDGFISRKGSAFSTKLKLGRDDMSGLLKVVFDFSDGS